MTTEEWVDEPSNVRAIGERSSPVEVHDLSKEPEREVDGSSYASGPLWEDTEPFERTNASPDPADYRRNLINQAAELADRSLETFRKAVDVLGIVDIRAHERYRELLGDLTEAVDEFINKL